MLLHTGEVSNGYLSLICAFIQNSIERMYYMTTSSDISSRFWNLPQKPYEETRREEIFIDDIIQKSHIEREILSRLDGIETAFDGGGGYGRFSLLMARKGIKVTHFDISESMLKKARELAHAEGLLENITFVHGALENLEDFEDGQFDMVLSFDAPISYTYPNHENVIENLIRIGSKKLIISVYSRLAWTYPFDPAQKLKYILDKEAKDPIVRWTMEQGVPRLPAHRPDMEAVWRLYETGLMERPEATAAAYEKGDTPWPVSYAFMPDELLDILGRNGAKNIKLAGPGALSRSIPHEVLVTLMREPELKRDFLDFCYHYDSQPFLSGCLQPDLLSGNGQGQSCGGSGFIKNFIKTLSLFFPFGKRFSQGGVNTFVLLFI